MKTIQTYLEGITIEEQKERMETIFHWLNSNYPQLEGVIKWTDDVDYNLLAKLIDYNLADKADCTTFFRK